MVRKILILLLLVSTALMANIGKIVALKGDITIVRDNNKITGELGSAILKADEILTKDNAKAQLLFNDNTVITIGKNSVFKVKEYLFDDTNKEYQTNFELLKGSFRTITGKIGKIAPKKFKLNSKTSSIGIRGTQILSRMAVDGDRIACIEGEIVITHLLTGQSIVIKAGEFVDLGIEAKTLKPQKLKQQDIKNMDETTRFTVSDEKDVELEDLGVVASTPENVAWGEWNEEAEETEDSSSTNTSQGGVGVTAPDVIVNATHSATYEGKVEGSNVSTSSGTSYSYIDNSSNYFKMTVNFGTNEISNGEMSAQYDNGQTWTDTFYFDGNVNSDGSGFSINQTSGGYSANDGTGSGQFYGSTGNIVKGDFDFDGSNMDTRGKGTFNATSD